MLTRRRPKTVTALAADRGAPDMSIDDGDVTGLLATWATGDRNALGLSDAGSVNVLYGSVSSNGLTGTNRQVHTADSIGFGSLAGARFGTSVY